MMRTRAAVGAEIADHDAAGVDPMPTLSAWARAP
jgi:hypothetical protein